jgi:hypothetical protein
VRGAKSLLDRAWLASLCLALLVPFLPWQAGGSLVLADWLGGYAGDVATRFYSLIRSAFLWIPVGFLLAATGSADRFKPWALAVALVSVPGAWLLFPAAGGAGALELFLALPGLALGMWLAAQTRGAVPAAGFESPVPVASVAPSPRACPAGIAQVDPATPGDRHVVNLAARMIALALLGVAATSLYRFPLMQAWLAIGLTLYLAVLWRFPAAALVVVPASLALLDLAHWSGRFFWDEFDLLMLATLAMALWQGRLRLSAFALPKLGTLLGLFVLASLVSLLLGLLPLERLDANAFSAYWSHYNSLRVGKGLLWGLVFYGLYRSFPDPAHAFSSLAIGMLVGMVGVALWMLWEQRMFAGAATTADYRATAGFSSMHTGGGHIEAYLVIALPFVWGLLFTLRNGLGRALAGVAFLLGTYALLFTVARGGVIALGVALLILVAGTWRSRHKRSRGATGLAGPLAIGVLALAIAAAGISGLFWQQRLAQSATDAGVRFDHWAEVLGLRDRGMLATLFGQGLGTLPAANLASQLPDKAGSYRYRTDGANTWLALNSAGDLYLAQRVAPHPAETLRLEVSVRALADGAGLQASLCEKILFNSRQCQWLEVPVKPGLREWQQQTLAFDSGEVGAGNLLTRRPVQLSLYNPAAGTVVEVDDVRLLDAQGRNLLQNGDFSQGGDFWLFKSGDHLFWHAKNLWVHVLFEQGWLGVVFLGLIMLLALVRLLRAMTGGQLEATVLTAAVGASAVVGVVDSLVDAPRLALLVYGLAFIGAAWGVSPRLMAVGKAHSRHHRKRMKHDTAPGAA